MDFHPRNYDEEDNLNQTAEYIFTHFQKAGGKPDYQEFEVRGRIYKNVRCVFGPGTAQRMVVGAHYDSYSDTPGADDNASGVAGLIELAYLLGADPADNDVELVSYPLEEPPFFASDKMGSYHHASQLSQEEVDIQGVIVLEMIGFFSDKKGSQGSPLLLFKLIYPFFIG